MRAIDHPLVSVILPVYNASEYVGMAIESVLNQTYGSLEIIVVDDGSTDDTLAVLRRYAAEDHRIQIVMQKHAGVARARNHAIELARGEFIAPLDSDDLWQPRKLERQVQRMREAGNSTGCVYAWWVWIDQSNAVLDCSPAWNIEGSIFQDLLQINFMGNASVPLFNRQRVIDAGGYNEQLAACNAGGCEDWDLALRVAERALVAVVPEVLVGYRRHAGSMSTACNTMRRSHQQMMREMKHLRPATPNRILRRSDQQFALYLSSLCFWTGDRIGAIRWGLQAGIRLPLAIAPYIARMLFFRLRDRKLLPKMRAGVTLHAEEIPSPLMPYNELWTSHSSDAIFQPR